MDHGHRRVSPENTHHLSFHFIDLPFRQNMNASAGHLYLHVSFLGSNNDSLNNYSQVPIQQRIFFWFLSIKYPIILALCPKITKVCVRTFARLVYSDTFNNVGFNNHHHLSPVFGPFTQMLLFISRVNSCSVCILKTYHRLYPSTPSHNRQEIYFLVNKGGNL